MDDRPSRGASPLRGLRRVAVIGPVGSGKSTFSRVLGERTGLPVVDLDRELDHGPGGGADLETWRSEQANLLERDRWILDGDYRAIAPDRFRAADTVVWLDLPRAVCWWRASRRGSARFASPVSRRTYWRWIWRYPRHGRRETEHALEGDDLTCSIHRVRTRKDVARLLEALGRTS